jgi:hypothetical protein
LGLSLDLPSDTPFVRPFPCDIVRRQSGGTTFYRRKAEFSCWAHLCGRWLSRLAAKAAEDLPSVRRIRKQVCGS